MTCPLLSLSLMFLSLKVVVFICLCLVLVPRVEVQLINSAGRYRQHSGDIELVHAIIVWMCLLGIYVFTVHVARRRVGIRLKSRSYCVRNARVHP